MLTYLKLIVSFSILLLAMPAWAETFTVYTNLAPPIKDVEDDRPTGITGDLLVELFRLSGHELEPITKVVPLVTALEKVKKEHGTVCLGLAKNPQRSPHYKWVGPIHTIKSGIVAKKSRALSIPSLKATKGLTIATVINSAPERMLMGKGLEKRQRRRFATTKEAIQALANDKVDGLLMPIAATYRSMNKMGIPTREYETAIVLNSIKLYFAFNRETSDETIEGMQQTLDAMKQTDSSGNSAYLEIIAKYSNPTP